MARTIVWGLRLRSTLLADLSPRIDPCGENGEFHVSATHRSMFCQLVDAVVEETAVRNGFAYADLIGAGQCRG